MSLILNTSTAKSTEVLRPFSCVHMTTNPYIRAIMRPVQVETAKVYDEHATVVPLLNVCAYIMICPWQRNTVGINSNWSSVWVLYGDPNLMF
jgi:hypothetical protein